jgi:hypothetical protein
MSRIDTGNGIVPKANAGASSGLLFEGRAVTPSHRELDVTFASFLRQETMTWRQLFEGFETLRAVTYSTSASFIRDLFDCVHDIEVIFGSDVSVKGDLSRLYAAQQVGVDAIKDEFGRAGKRLLQLLKEDHLRLFYANYAVHRKVFILEGSGKRRVILGSANMSAAAFGGLQSEQLVVFDDDSGMYEAERLMYDALLKDTAPIPPDIFRKEGSVEIDEIPTFSKILRTREAFVVEPAKVGTPGPAPSSSDATVFVLRTEDLRRHFVNALPQLAAKPLALTADIIRKVKEQRRQNVLVKGIESREIPRLEVDPERAEVRYQNKPMDLAPADAEVAADAHMLDEFFRGYPLYFSGKVSELVQDYCAFLAWFFAAPFVCLARDAAVHNDCNVFRYPVCGVLYGKSNAGKTDLVKVLMRAMFGHQWWLIPRDFTMTTFYALAERGGSFPIVIDDISRDKFREPAVAIIKQDFRMGLYPALVLSTNQDVRAVEP